MNYYTSQEAAVLLGVTKRYITKLCAKGEISGAKKKGNRWMLPETVIRGRMKKAKAPRRVFNTTGICNPAEHYMVDLTRRLLEVKKLIDEGKYFTINRARQFGKTTMLRGYYINRSRFATFQSVILAGVCDIRNLKRKMRPDEEHKDNSPWNIAADFDVDMSFSAEQINEMLLDYANDHGSDMDTEMIAQEIYDYTSGYPYLVSRLCQLIDEMQNNGNHAAWLHEGVLESVRSLVRESNSLFDDMAKKVKDYPELEEMLRDLLFCGKSIPFNLGTELVSIGAMFGFLKDEDGQVAIANRIFEIWFCNLFIAQDAIDSKTYETGQQLKGQFVTDNGLDIDRILRKFQKSYPG